MLWMTSHYSACFPLLCLLLLFAANNCGLVLLITSGHWLLYVSSVCLRRCCLFYTLPTDRWRDGDDDAARRGRQENDLFGRDRYSALFTTSPPSTSTPYVDCVVWRHLNGHRRDRAGWRAGGGVPTWRTLKAWCGLWAGGSAADDGRQAKRTVERFFPDSILPY